MNSQSPTSDPSKTPTESPSSAPPYKSCQDVWEQSDNSSALLDTSNEYNLESPYGLSRCIFTNFDIFNKIFIGVMFNSFARSNVGLQRCVFGDSSDSCIASQDIPNYSNFRWSTSRTDSYRDSIINSSSIPYLFVTCNGLTSFGNSYNDGNDHLLMKFYDLLMDSTVGNTCLDVLSINIRDRGCANTTIPFWMDGVGNTGHQFHTDASYGHNCANYNTDCTYKDNAFNEEDNFGQYATVNTAFTCSASLLSTTNLFVGSLIDKPTLSPSVEPTIEPTKEPSKSPTQSPIIPYSSWVTSPSPLNMPRSNYRQAVGLNTLNNYLWLIGGVRPNDLVRYSLDADNAIYNVSDYGSSYFSLNMMFLSQSYTQQRNLLYMISDTSSAPNPNIHKLDLSTTPPTTFYNNISTPTSTYSSCLVSMTMNNHDYLIVIGGGEDRTYRIGPLRDNTQIYDLTDNTWITSRDPQLNTGRERFACVIVNDMIYALGGYGTVLLDTIEVLDVSAGMNNVTDYSWVVLPETFPTGGLCHHNAVVFGTDIIIIGGTSATGTGGNGNTDVVLVVDTTTNNIYSPGTLNQHVRIPTSIVVYPYIYTFGGNADAYGWQVAYQYNILPETESPTLSPSNQPTIPPTLEPTMEPTIEPTETPTYSPTYRNYNYIVHTESGGMNFTDAKAYCNSIGGNLASIHSELEKNITQQLCQSTDALPSTSIVSSEADVP